MTKKGVFHTPYDQYREHEGQPFTLLGEADRSTTDYDEAGSLYRISFDDGTEIDAWPEEIESVLGPQRTDLP